MNIEQEILELKSRIEQLEKFLEIKCSPQSSAKAPAEAPKRDKTKYMFNGVIYPKNRLVLAIINQYVKDNSPSYPELNTIFNKSLQGSLNVVELIGNANQISDASKRYFMAPDEQITLKDNNIIVVCTQWGKFNIDKFVKRVEQLGFVIDRI